MCGAAHAMGKEGRELAEVQARGRECSRCDWGCRPGRPAHAGAHPQLLVSKKMWRAAVALVMCGRCSKRASMMPRPKLWSFRSAFVI